MSKPRAPRPKPASKRHASREIVERAQQAAEREAEQEALRRQRPASAWESAEELEQRLSQLGFHYQARHFLVPGDDTVLAIARILRATSVAAGRDPRWLQETARSAEALLDRTLKAGGVQRTTYEQAIALERLVTEGLAASVSMHELATRFVVATLDMRSPFRTKLARAKADVRWFDSRPAHVTAVEAVFHGIVDRNAVNPGALEPRDFVRKGLSIMGFPRADLVFNAEKSARTRQHRKRKS